jgi:hypothetical protein
MLPEIPHELALHPGPIASAYLEVSRDRGGAAHEVRLRWEALAEALREQEADEKTQPSAPLSAPGTPSRSSSRSAAAPGDWLRKVWHQ